MRIAIQLNKYILVLELPNLHKITRSERIGKYPEIDLQCSVADPAAE